MTGEMKIRDFKVNEIALLDPAKKAVLEELVVKIRLKKSQQKRQRIFSVLILAIWLECSEAEIEEECLIFQDYHRSFLRINKEKFVDF